MRPSEQVRLIIYGLMSSPILEGPAGWWKDERAPLRHMIAERKSEKLNTTVQWVSCRQKAK